MVSDEIRKNCVAVETVLVLVTKIETATFMEKHHTQIKQNLTSSTTAFLAYTALGAGGKTPPREPVKDLMSDDCVSDIVEGDNLKPCISHKSFLSSIDRGDDLGKANSPTQVHLRI